MLPLKNFLFRRSKPSLIFGLFVLCALQTPAQGLQFNANDSLLTKRTSFVVFNNKSVSFKNHLHIDFDLSIWDKSNLGYILNLAEKNNSYSLSYLYNNGAGFLNFNIDSKSNKLQIPISSAYLKRKKWMKVKMDFDLNADAANITINNATYHVDKLGLNKTINAKLIFGKNPLYTDVPQMAIKDLSVYNDSKRYFFPLNEWNGSNVHDSNGNSIGYVENPYWLINESYFWKPFYKQAFQNVSGLNFDPLNQKLFIFSKDSLITYDAEERTVTATPYKNKMPVAMVLGKNIFNAKENKCYVYELFDVAKGAPSLASCDMNTLQWQPIGKASMANQLHHHNIFYSLNQDTIFLFGGYGAYHYHNAFLYYSETADEWIPASFKGDKITPRFFSAIGAADSANEIFLFGGYGNESGNQVVGGRQYYDLYRINLKDHTVKKCWEMRPDSGVFVPANNLILSADKKYFYALCYPHEVAKTELTLYKFSIKDGSYEPVSAPIPVTSERIESDVNLFYNNITNEFFCTEQEFADRNKSTIKIFSLEAPPLSRALYSRSLIPHKKTDSFLVYIILGILASAVTVIILLRNSSSKKQRLDKPQIQVIPVVTQPNLEIETFQPDEIIAEETKQNALYLLGDFLVYDKKGRDITYLFSPKIKQLFTLILLHSINGDGIGSKKISAILWPDKDVVKTKNIRGVTFNHLRSAISDIKGIELTFSGDNYSFKLNEDCFCDYCEVSKLFKEEKIQPLKQHDIRLILRGDLLKETHEAWMENFKQDYEKRLIHLLNPELNRLYIENSLTQALKIAQLILSIEPFNDEALKYEINIYKKLKGSDYAKKVFEHFAREYKRSIGADYPVDYEKLNEVHSHIL